MKNNLRQLAINDEGFAFDPRTGDCFKLNTTAQTILRALKLNKSTEQIATQISSEFGISELEALEDIQDFLFQLKIQGLAV